MVEFQQKEPINTKSRESVPQNINLFSVNFNHATITLSSNIIFCLCMVKENTDDLPEICSVCVCVCVSNATLIWSVPFKSTEMQFAGEYNWWSIRLKIEYLRCIFSNIKSQSIGRIMGYTFYMGIHCDVAMKTTPCVMTLHKRWTHFVTSVKILDWADASVYAFFKKLI